MTNHEWLWEKGSFIKHDKSGKSNVTRNGNSM
jgi:hypothetical protein